jgi:hypothetical protein
VKGQLELSQEGTERGKEWHDFVSMSDSMDSCTLAIGFQGIKGNFGTKKGGGEGFHPQKHYCSLFKMLYLLLPVL